MEKYHFSSSLFHARRTCFSSNRMMALIGLSGSGFAEVGGDVDEAGCTGTFTEAALVVMLCVAGGGFEERWEILWAHGLVWFGLVGRLGVGKAGLPDLHEGMEVVVVGGFEGGLNPEGIGACSRWLSEGRAIPPDRKRKCLASRRDGSVCRRRYRERRSALASLPGCDVCGTVNRWCRSCLAQPPATCWEAFGFRNARIVAQSR